MLPNMVPPRDSGRRLTADDWVQAGFAVLAESGPNALRIDRLCERLEVTKGSFYWHFTDLSAYRGALSAFVVFSAGVGLLHASGSAPAAPPDLQDAFLDFMLRP